MHVPSLTSPPDASSTRMVWVDVAKALCIILVVMMHSTLGLQGALGRTGFLDPVMAFFAPFRIPTFFVLSGLFLARALRRPFDHYAQARIVHFGYFYLLWLAIHLAVRSGRQIIADPHAAAADFLLALVQPYDTLWFLHLLMAFSFAAYVLRRFEPLVVLAGAAALHLVRVQTGSVLLDEFAARAVFFAAGWALAPAFFALARFALARPRAAAAAIGAFAVANAFVVLLTAAAHWHVVGLMLGLAGAAALTLLASQLAATPILGRWLAALGRRSLVVYVAFTLPMAALRLASIKMGLFVDGWLAIGFGSLLITAGAIAAPLLLERLVHGSVFGLLFVRRAAPAAERDQPTPRVSALSAVR